MTVHRIGGPREIWIGHSSIHSASLVTKPNETAAKAMAPWRGGLAQRWRCIRNCWVRNSDGTQAFVVVLLIPSRPMLGQYFDYATTASFYTVYPAQRALERGKTPILSDERRSEGEILSDHTASHLRRLYLWYRCENLKSSISLLK
jgi:hypothetical protein